MFSERNKLHVRQLSLPAKQQLIKLFQVSVTAKQFQFAINEARPVSIPRFDQYFSTGLNQASLLTVERLIQKDWNQYRKFLENLKSYE